MTVRKPTSLRWSEEAEANHVREWAELERGALDGAARPEFAGAQLLGLPDRTGLFCWFRLLLRRRNSQIMQDG